MIFHGRLESKVQVVGPEVQLRQLATILFKIAEMKLRVEMEMIVQWITET